MEININYVFKTVDGKPIKKTVGFDNGGIPIAGKDNFTLKSLCLNALNTDFSNPQQWGANAEKISGEDKFKRGALSMEIYKANDKINLPAEDITLLKKLIGMLSTPLIVHQAYETLDGTTKQK